MEGSLKITLKRSPVGKKGRHGEVLRGLGVRRPGRSVIRKDTPEIRGMLFKVKHLVEVEEVP